MVNLGHEMSKDLFRYIKSLYIFFFSSKSAPDSPVIEALAHSYPSGPGPDHNDMEALGWTGRRASQGPEEEHQETGEAQGSNGHQPTIHHQGILSERMAIATPQRFQLVTKANPAQYMKNVRNFFPRTNCFRASYV